MGAAAIASTLAFIGTAFAIVSAVLIILLLNKIGELREIADNQNLADMNRNLNTAQILAWIAAALGLITAIAFVATPYIKWLKIIGVILTLAALAASMAYLGIAYGSIGRLGENEQNELRGYIIGAIATNATAMALFIVALIVSFFAKKPEEDIYKEGKYPGGVFAQQEVDFY